MLFKWTFTQCNKILNVRIVLLQNFSNDGKYRFQQLESIFLSFSLALFGKACIMNIDREVDRTKSFRWYIHSYAVINLSLNRDCWNITGHT